MTGKLREVGGSTMLTVPPESLRVLHLEAGDTLAMTVEDGRLIAEPLPRPRYTMAELLAASDYAGPQPVEGREWVNAGAVGRELL